MQAVCSSRNAALLQLTLRIVRKLLWMLLVLWGITLISFWVIHLAPGSPTDMETTLNPLAGEAARQRLEALYGLDKPLHVQYLDWLSRLVRLDFGLSMSADGRPVLDKIMERLPLTVGMNVISLILTLIIAIPIGILSACRQNSLLDRGVTVFVYLGFAMPSFWLAVLLILLFSSNLGLLPASGALPAFFSDPGGWCARMALPAFALAVPVAGQMIRVIRTSMVEELDKDYVRTARGFGIPMGPVVAKNVLRNALISPVTVLGLKIAHLIGGAVVIEVIFNLPGMGMLILQGIQANYITLIQGVVLVVALAFIIINIIVDMLYVLIDPRIRTV